MKWLIGSNTPVLYNVSNLNIKVLKCRVAKSMLNSISNKTEDGERYRKELLGLTERVSKAEADTAEEVVREAVRTITKPWVYMAMIKRITASPHWNFKLDYCW